MIGVDTNVLARLFVTDDERQHLISTQFFLARSSADPAFVSLVVVAELAWLLSDAYEFAYGSIIEVFQRMLDSPDFVIERSDLLLRTLELGRERRIDIADSLIAALAREAGSEHTVTFDREAAKRVPGMELLK